MRYPVAFFASLMLVAMFAACRPAPSSQSLSGQSPSSQTQAASADQKQVTEAQKASSKPPLEFLLTSSADDFHTHHPPDPTGFRQVRLGHVVSGDGATQYMLCGEFLAAAEKGNAEWMYFATIRHPDTNNGLARKHAACARVRRSCGIARTICRRRCSASLIRCASGDEALRWDGRSFTA